MNLSPEQSDEPSVRQDRTRELIARLVATEAELQALADGQANAIHDPSLTGLYLILFNRRSPFQNFFILSSGWLHVSDRSCSRHNLHTGFARKSGFHGCKPQVGLPVETPWSDPR